MNSTCKGSKAFVWRCWETNAHGVYWSEEGLVNARDVSNGDMV